jgi:uncharacterized protein (TIGR03000 family)
MGMGHFSMPHHFSMPTSSFGRGFSSGFRSSGFGHMPVRMPSTGMGVRPVPSTGMMSTGRVTQPIMFHSANLAPAALKAVQFKTVPTRGIQAVHTTTAVHTTPVRNVGATTPVTPVKNAAVTLPTIVRGTGFRTLPSAPVPSTFSQIPALNPALSGFFSPFSPFNQFNHFGFPWWWWGGGWWPWWSWWPGGGYGGGDYGGYGGYGGYDLGYNPYANPYTSAYGYNAAQAAVPAAPALGDNTATIEVVLPDANAQVWINGAKMTGNGVRRTFTSDPLQPGATSTFTVKATWNEGGQPTTVERQVTVRAGGRVVVQFAKTPAQVSSAPY